ncbi:MAG: M28 family peptidase [Peptostreptococcaceae bacterium]
MKLKKNISYLMVLIFLAVAAIIGYNSLNPSKPNYDDYSKVNVNNQMNHIKNIAKEPHSIFDLKAKEDVRNYLISELDKLGVESKIYNYEDVYVERTKTKEDIQNVYAQIDGKSDSYIMLVTHYDSSHAKTERYAEKDGSLGAADAGYAMSTILETLRVIKESNVELENGIKILFTDGEEYGLLGAKEAVKEKEIFEGVNYLINIEARGTKGPAIMFETSQNNSSVIDLYEHSEKPFSYSITPEIYRLLPNGTDFTVFLDNDITGINISVLDGLENYHTPSDNPNNLSEESLQHYGDQVLPVVKEYVSNEKYSNADSFESKDDSIFFTLGNVFIKYSKTINYVLLLVILVGIVLLYKKFKVESILKVFKFTGINLVFTVGAMGVSYGISRLMAMINNRPFKLTYLPLIKFEGLIILSVIAITFVAYVMVIRKLSNKFSEKNEFILGSLVLLLILSIILTIALPGGSYLTVFPALLIVVFTLIKTAFESNENVSYIMIVPLFIITVLYVPTIYLFNCALTFGALCATMMFVMIGFISLLSGMVSIKGIINVENLKRAYYR